MYAAWLCGMVFLDKISPQSRADSVEKMVRVLKGGSSVILYPEGAWNNTENLLVQPLFAGPWLLARRTGCKVVPIAMYHTYKAKDIYFRAGEPMDLAGMEKRAELSPEPRLDYIDERMREYLCTKWTRDDWAMEVTIYRDKALPPPPEAVRASFDNVNITLQNAAILPPILARREEDKKYDLVKYMQRNWKK